tara:strand:+ start:433 stop:612 length:180 start_codon:yes stop_codon:yes gene_type:complete
MKKIILLILLTSCSFNNKSNYWSNNLKKELLDFDKDYSFIEFKSILEKYNARKDYPEIN